MRRKNEQHGSARKINFISLVLTRALFTPEVIHTLQNELNQHVHKLDVHNG